MTMTKAKPHSEHTIALTRNQVREHIASGKPLPAHLRGLSEDEIVAAALANLHAALSERCKKAAKTRKMRAEAGITGKQIAGAKKALADRGLVIEVSTYAPPKS